jgi:glycosyltransferase involved in cell wall biosynthesis
VPAIKILQAPYLVPKVPAVPEQASADGSRPAGDGPCTFVFVGRLIPSKGVDLLLRAVARAATEHGTDCRLVIVGDGPERLALEALCDDLGLRPRVVFAGWIEYARLAEYYQRSDVFVFPTLQDYRSLASFEALAFALPLLVSRYDGACGEVVVEGENGFVFDPRDGTAFAEKLAWLAKHPHARQAFRTRSRAIGERFSLDRAVDAFVEATARAADHGKR